MARLLTGAVDSWLGLVVKHAHKANVIGQVTQQRRQIVGDTDPTELIRIVRPHQFMVVDFAEGTHPHLRFVLYYRFSYPAVMTTLSQVFTRAK
jgi:hypothetical protein